MVERRPVGHLLAEEGQVALRVVADGIFVIIASAQPSVASPVVVLNAPALVRVVGVGVAAALKVRGERICRVSEPSGVEVGQPGLPAVTTRYPAKEVIERSV